MAETGYAEAELQAAIEQLAEGDGLREAESVVASAAPQLQGVLAEALAAGGWFEGAHLEQLQRALAIEDAEERLIAVRTLAAEETRIAMMVGVAVGWALATELGAERDAAGPTTTAADDSNDSDANPDDEEMNH